MIQSEELEREREIRASGNDIRMEELYVYTTSPNMEVTMRMMRREIRWFGMRKSGRGLECTSRL